MVVLGGKEKVVSRSKEGRGSSGKKREKKSLLAFIIKEKVG